ncbi:hypothetical protein [Methylobacterium sp. Leaf108]|uniref:hypothetical protein n=1 Tax=Methylobacterium sp. Leaf108 TaxID=1736256 RepID=UPI0006FC10FC|nr:hypothetical protein [Methylobacterium sp. Leaf108]KQP48972.1 hypothetical protein ASF39_14580 [Methylobacterium sp. Leaf108]
MATNEAGQRHPLRFDPDGASIGPEVPESLLIRWKEMLANCAKAQHRLHSFYERTFKDQDACVRVISGLLEDTSGIADDMRALVNLFNMALESEGVDGKLTEALRLVTSSIMTMADRLNSLEEEGDAARERYFQ